MTAEPESLVLVHLSELRTEMASRFDAVDARLDPMDSRLDRIEARQDKAAAWQVFLDGRLAAWEERQKRLEARLESVEGGLAVIAPAVHTLATARGRQDDEMVERHRRVLALDTAVGLAR